MGCNVNDSTIGHALAISTSKFLFNENKGYNLMQTYCDHMNLNGGYARWDTVEVNPDKVAVLNEEFPPKRFIHSFIGLQEQKTSSSICKVCMFRCM